MSTRFTKVQGPLSIVHCRPGYIALLSILIVSAMAATTVLILFVTGITSTLNSGDTFNGKLAKSLAEGCMERALQSLTSCDILCKTGTPADCNDASTPDCASSPPIAFGNNQCSIFSIEETAPTVWRLRTTGTVGTVKKYIEVEATKPVPPPDVAAETTSWKECLDFSSTPCDTP